MKVQANSADAGFLRRRRWHLFGLAAAVGVAMLVTGAGSGLDQMLRGMRDSLRAHPASGEVHIVEIDARSLARINRWPWPRGIHAAAVDKLSQAGVRSIAFDVDFSAVSDPVEDAKLAAALKRADTSVTLPTFRQYASSGSSDYIDSVPIKSLAENGFHAAVNVIPDSDGYIRRMPLGLETRGVPRPSLASMIAERAAEVDHYFEIDYSIDQTTIPRHSFVDLIEGKVPASVLAGKRVVIGATAVEMGDRYSAPRNGVIPGVVIQALAAETLLEGPIPQKWSGAWLLAWVLGLTVLALRPGRRPLRMAMFGAGVGTALVISLITEAWLAISLPLAPALGAAAMAALLGGAALLVEKYWLGLLVDRETDLPNLMALEVELAERGQASIVVARIERFAAIAAGLGPVHTAQLMVRISERIKFAVQERTVYRTDDSTFAWIESPDMAATLEERLEALAALMRAPVECGQLVDASLSFGLAEGEGRDAKQLVANAGLAALHAARNGRRWERFAQIDSDETSWHLSLLGQLEAAMATGQLWNAYQPKLDLRSGRVVAVEALVRWDHPERGAIGPDEFIPMVEDHGRARELTMHVLHQALEDTALWEEGGFAIGVAVNVSATLLADHAFIELVRQTLQHSRVPTNRVTIEVTETAAMHSPEQAIAALESWRALGINISIDDYGTGQSSLNYLQKLPASELKIDRAFIQGVNKDPRNAIMVRSTIALAHELGMTVVAEGIEDSDCLRVVAEMGCDVAQGYFIGRPMPAWALTHFLATGTRAAA